jgi:hypothetical protein
MGLFDELKKAALNRACEIGRQYISALNSHDNYPDSDAKQALEDKSYEQIQKLSKNLETQVEELKKIKKEQKNKATDVDEKRGKSRQPQIPPPSPFGFSYYAIIEGAQHGPYDKNQFKRLVDKDMVSSSTMVWKEGMEKWMPAMEIEDMKDFFKPQTTPPPIPNF